jgi:hypothetical protein
METNQKKKKNYVKSLENNKTLKVEEGWPYQLPWPGARSKEVDINHYSWGE